MAIARTAIIASVFVKTIEIDQQVVSFNNVQASVPSLVYRVKSVYI